MINSMISEEFIGRFGISYKDEKTVYAYDEITHGLYELQLDFRKVNLVIPSKYIPQNMNNGFRGISKNGNEIILIPTFLDSEWIFYNLEEKSVRYQSLVKDKIRISDVVTIGKTLFLIPSDIYNPIVIVSYENEKKVNIYNDWFDNDELKPEICDIWGASFYDHIIVFPIINSKQTVYIKNNEITIVENKIPYPILSVCIYENNIWILPVSGEKIYSVDFKGDIVEEIKLSIEGMNISASDFIRIIVTEENVFLLPTQGKNILVYQYKENQIVQLKEEGTCLPGKLFVPSDITYWDYIIENKVMHLLPSGVRLKSIDLISLKNIEYALQYGDNIDSDVYWKMITTVQRNYIFNENEERDSDLNEFLEFLDHLFIDSSKKASLKNGRKIWNSIW